MKKSNWKDRSMENNSHWRGGVIVEPSGRVLIRVNRQYVYRYRLVMEEQLGRKLRKDEIVHHINKKVDDDRPENLEVISQKEHMKRHELHTSKEINDKRRRFGKDNGFFEKHHTEETKVILRQKAKGRKPARLNAILSDKTKNSISESLIAYNKTEAGILNRQKGWETRRRNKLNNNQNI